MTHQAHPSVTREVVQVLAEHGFDGMAQAMELLLNECMKIERQQALGVGPYQRSEARRGQANGFKPKRVKTRIGQLELSVPQVRGAKFYPQALERGSRSEKALRLALAEMYVQGVSTAKVTRITEELCGCEISSSDVDPQAGAPGDRAVGRRVPSVADPSVGPLEVPDPRRSLREDPSSWLRGGLCRPGGHWRGL